MLETWYTSKNFRNVRFPMGVMLMPLRIGITVTDVYLKTFFNTMRGGKKECVIIDATKRFKK